VIWHAAHVGLHRRTCCWKAWFKAGWVAALNAQYSSAPNDLHLRTSDVSVSGGCTFLLAFLDSLMGAAISCVHKEWSFIVMHTSP